MFDLIEGKADRPFRDRAPGSKVVAAVVHVTIIGLVIAIPLLSVNNVIPEVPTLMAFVSAPPAPPPPPPPPPPPARPAAAQAAPQPETKPPSADAAPIEAPSEITPEVKTASAEVAGVEGGVEGGVPGGVVGGIVGGIMPPAPPPPPAPTPTPAPRGPVRIGGQLMAPALVRRVDPVFPDFAAAARLAGVVILEAVVDTEGHVQSVTVLRSRHPLLDRAAVEALHQWQYSPLVLNNIPTPFVLTVTFNFSVGP